LEKPWAPAARGRYRIPDPAPVTRPTLDQLVSKNILVFGGILSFREDYSRSAFPNGNNLTNESNTLVTISEENALSFESNPLVLRLLFFWVGLERTEPNLKGTTDLIGEFRRKEIEQPANIRTQGILPTYSSYLQLAEWF